MRSPPDGPASPATPSPNDGRRRSAPARLLAGTAGSRPKTPSRRLDGNSTKMIRGADLLTRRDGRTSWSKPDNWKLQEQEDVPGRRN